MGKQGLLQAGVLGMVLMFSTGCATIVTGRDTGYPIMTQPEGAKVLVNGLFQGTTPLLLEMDRNSNYLVRVEKEGCPHFDTLISSQMNPWLVGNIVFGGLIGLLIDAATGSSSRLSPTYVSLMYTEQDGKCVIAGAPRGRYPEDQWQEPQQLIKSSKIYPSAEVH